MERKTFIETERLDEIQSLLNGLIQSHVEMDIRLLNLSSQLSAVKTSLTKENAELKRLLTACFVLLADTDRGNSPHP